MSEIHSLRTYDVLFFSGICHASQVVATLRSFRIFIKKYIISVPLINKYLLGAPDAGTTVVTRQSPSIDRP